MLFVFIYVYWCPTWFQYHMMFVSLNSNTGVTCGRWTVNPSGAPEFTSVFSEIRVVGSLVVCVCPFVLFLLATVLAVLLRITASDYPFGILWPLCWLFFFELRLLITPLVSCGHCVVCSSNYGFWLPLWYLVAIVLSVLLRITASNYPFGIFKLFLEFLIGSIFFEFGRRSFCRLELISFQVSEVVIAITFCAVTWHKCC